MLAEFKHPLRIPDGWPKTPFVERTYNQDFSATMTLKDACQYLKEEIEGFGARAGVVYTDVDNIFNDRLRRKIGPESAVAVQLSIGDHRYDFYCDHWQLIEHNMYAIHLMLRNFKMMARWGAGDLSRLMLGYLDLSYSRNSDAGHLVIDATDWRSALGLGPTATLDDADAVYRRRAKAVASDPEALLNLNRAIEAARQVLKR